MVDAVTVETIGDNVHDAGPDIQAAHDALGSKGGEIILLPPASAYRVATPLSFTKDNVRLYTLGGRATTYINFDLASGIGLTWTGSNFEVARITFQAVQANNTMTAVRVRDAGYGDFHKVGFTGAGTAGLELYNLQNCGFHGINATANPGDGILATHGTNGHIVIDNHSLISSNGGYGLNLIPNDFGFVVAHCNIGLNTAGELIASGAVNRLLLDDNVFETSTFPTNTNHAIMQFLGGGSYNYGPTLRDNKISYSANDILVPTYLYFDWMEDIRIAGNDFLSTFAAARTCMHFTANNKDVRLSQNWRADNLQTGLFVVNDGISGFYQIENQGISVTNDDVNSLLFTQVYS